MVEETIKTIREAEKEGVRILAYDCIVRKDLINLSKPVRVLLDKKKQEQVC